MKRIAQILGKCKRGVGALFETSRREDVFLILLITLVGFGGFGLGRLSKISEERSPVRMFQESVLLSRAAERGDETTPSFLEGTSPQQFVASVSGTKYHLPWCSGASSIKEENKIWFSTSDEARLAGYEPAANCPGLKN